MLIETLITALESIPALVISVIAIWYATRDTNKQILVAKIEVAYEITLFLYYYYKTQN